MDDDFPELDIGLNSPEEILAFDAVKEESPDLDEPDSPDLDQASIQADDESIYLFRRNEERESSAGSDGSSLHEKPKGSKRNDTANTQSSDAGSRPHNKTHEPEGLTISPKGPDPEAESRRPRRTTSHPEFVIKNQLVVRPEGVSEDKTVQLANIVEGVRNVGLELHGDPTGAEHSSQVNNTAVSGNPNSPSAPATPEQGKQSRLYSVAEGALYNLASFLPAHLVDAGSNTGTRGSGTPQLEDSGGEASDAPTYPLEPVQMDNSSYYIFDPKSSGFAHYLHRDADQSGDAEAGYQIYQVPMSVVPLRTGGFAYQVGISDKDCIDPNRIQQGFTAPRTNDVHHELRTTVFKDTSTDSRPEDKALLRDLFDDGMAEARKGVVSRVVEHLEGQHNLRSLDAVSNVEGLHLVSNEEIHDIVETTMQKIRQARQLKDGGEARTPETPRTLSKLRLDEVANAINPPRATVADAATTFSVPNTAYTSLNPEDLQVETKVRGSDSSTMTTVVSRQSVTEITWKKGFDPSLLANKLSSKGGEPRVVSPSTALTYGPATWGSSTQRKSHPSITMYRPAMDPPAPFPNMAELVAGFPPTQDIHTSSETEITSFPRLSPQHSAAEMLYPVTLKETTQGPPSDLYRQGVDAHSGSLKRPSSTSAEEPVQPRPCDHSVFKRNPFHHKPDAKGEGDMSKIANMIAAEKKQSAGVGSPSPQPEDAQGDKYGPSSDLDSFLPLLIKKIQKSSHKIFHPHHSQKNSDVEDVNEAEAGEVELFSSSRAAEERAVEEDTSTRRQTEGAKKDTTRATADALSVGRKRGNTCSEDNRPHQCEDDSYK